MFGIGPIWLFFFKQRLPFGMMRSGMEPWVSTMATNLAILVLALGLIWFVGLGPFLLVQLPIVVMAVAGGAWLFAVHRPVGETHLAPDPPWQLPPARPRGPP